MTVISTEEAMDMLPVSHKPPSKSQLKPYIACLQKQGLIEPLAALHHRIWDGPDICRVYAAVELGWDTVIVDFKGVSSG